MKDYIIGYIKRYIGLALFIGISILGIPMLVLYATDFDKEELYKRVKAEMNKEYVSLDIIDESVLVGILAKQIPYTYEDEAIKVQAVISRTYMARRIFGIQTKGILEGYTEDEMHNMWGADYENIYAIYKKAIKDTYYEVITYDNELIEPLYHKSSSGKTRDAKSIYNMDIPYLKSTESDVDKIRKQIDFTGEEIMRLVSHTYPEITLFGDSLENQIQIIDRDDAGYVESIQISNIVMDGEEFRKILKLPSACFEIYSKDKKLVLDIRGEGDGIGLSQNGANELAKQGMSYNDIISYYYKDVNVEKRDEDN